MNIVTFLICWYGVMIGKFRSIHYMDASITSYIHLILGWNYLSSSKLQWCNRLKFGWYYLIAKHIWNQYTKKVYCFILMMTSSNGNIFRVTGPLCGEFTGPGEFPTQRPVTRSFNVFFDLLLNKRLSKQPWGWWFETPSWSLWRQCNGIAFIALVIGGLMPEGATDW